jgi:hypothetical protein
MKPPKSSSHVPTLSDLIEIIRDPQQPSIPDLSFPPDIDESNPLYTLNQLVEKLESIVDEDAQDSALNPNRLNLHHQKLDTHSSDLERYIELFQKQSAVLRKVMPKLH